MDIENAHTMEVTSMELPLDWDNFYDDDESTIGVEASSVSEGLLLSLSRLGRVDIEFIASITGETYKSVIDKLKGAIYQNPVTWGECFFMGWETADEYLSGNVRHKLAVAIEANENYAGYFEENVKALKEILPSGVSAEEIYITLGSPWVPTDVIAAFISRVLYGEVGWRNHYGSFLLRHDEETGTWEYAFPYMYYSHSLTACEKYGTKRRNMFDILLRTLNMQSIAVYDTKRMSNDVKMWNIPEMSVGEGVDVLANAYCKLIKAGEKITKMPSVMLWGPPGVGKSQGVRQLADRIHQETGKRVHVTDVRLLLFNPIDLRGIPTANEDKTLAVWLKPQIFQMEEDVDVINILFLDEISAAPPSVQAAAYQITLDRVIGEHRLPDNCIVIAAGNRVTDKSVAYKMPKALANRLLHIEMSVDEQAWKSWAMEQSVHPMVIGFLQFRKDALMQFEPGKDDLAFPTPRSWEKVSDILNYITSDIAISYPLISGLIGQEAAAEFRTWMEVYNELPSMEGIFSGKTTKGK